MLIFNAVFVLEISPRYHKCDMTDHKPTIAVVIFFPVVHDSVACRPTVFRVYRRLLNVSRCGCAKPSETNDADMPIVKRSKMFHGLWAARFPRAQLNFHLDDSRFHRKHALMLLDVAFVATRFSTFEI